MFEKITKPLFILEMANNHMGDLQHGKALLKAFADATRPYADRFDFAFKLQLRDPSIIHPDYQDRTDYKFIKRFTETRLSKDEFRALRDAILENGFLSMCTPFDEASVGVMDEIGFDIHKIASCSFIDWPLLEVFVKSDKPMILSCGGASLEQIDRVVSFFQHRNKDFCLMHCVAEYPVPDDGLQMNQIDLLQQRYNGLPIGFSTHENPDCTDAVKLAVAKGCMVFEKHVGLPTDKYSINAYSSTPEQVGRWVEAASQAFAMCGVSDQRMLFREETLKDLKALSRGVFLSKDIAAGDKISSASTFVAMPSQEGQILASELSKYTDIVAKKAIAERAPVMAADIDICYTREKVEGIAKAISRMLISANVAVPNGVGCSISTHYGLDRFEEYGVVALNILNREYCKKLLVMLPGQKHPTHHHKVKEETFHILHGDFTTVIEGEEIHLKRGDLLTVHRGQNHSFCTEGGVIIEEISTTHVKDDSYYEDPAIMANANRKIELSIWPDLFEQVQQSS